MEGFMPGTRDHSLDSERSTSEQVEVTSGRGLSDDEKPIFVYGTLLDPQTSNAVFGSLAIQTEHAVAIGKKAGSKELPGVIFSPNLDLIEGRLVLIRHNDFHAAITRLDNYEQVSEGLYRRTTIRVRLTDGSERQAYAYEWAGTSDRPRRYQDYLVAARRKIEIARYHGDCLESLTPNELSIIENGLPLVKVQAHLEGLIYAFIAATDQLGEGLNLGLRLHLYQPNLQNAIEGMDKRKSQLRRDLQRWQENPLAKDVRELRRQATHHHYGKTQQGPQWLVDHLPKSRYSGSRDLDEYSKAVLEHLEKLLTIIDEYDTQLKNETPMD